jgi:hypothetical protein
MGQPNHQTAAWFPNRKSTHGDAEKLKLLQPISNQIQNAKPSGTLKGTAAESLSLCWVTIHAKMSCF